MMREVIKHRGAKVKLSQADIDEIVEFLIIGDVTFEDLANTYQVQLQYIKNIFNGKGRFKYLLGTERYFKMHETQRKIKEEKLKRAQQMNYSSSNPTPNKNGKKTLRSMSQEELDILYTRLHNEQAVDLVTEYGIGQPQLSKLKHNKFKSFKGNLLVGEEESSKEDIRGTDIKIIKDCDMPLPDEKFVKAELLDLARKTAISKELSIEDVLKNHLDCVGKSRLYDLLNREEYLKHSIKNKFTNDMQTGLLIYEVLHLITSYSTFEIGMMIQEIKESKYED
jgi:hypothetical protein